MAAFVTNAAAFDGNWLLNRAFFATALPAINRAIKEERPLPDWHRGVVELVCNWVMRDAMVGGAKLFDGNKNFRKDIYPEYKSGRHKNREEKSNKEGAVSMEISCYDALPELLHQIDAYGIPWYQDPRHEADDLFASLSHWQKDRNEVLWLVCNDKDMVQLVRSNVCCYKPPVGKKEAVRITMATVQHLKKGMTAQQHLAYQILSGDAVDSIPGVMSHAAANRIVTDPSFVNLKTWFKTKVGKECLNQYRAELVRTKQLVTLVTDVFEERPSLTVKRVRVPTGAPRVAHDFQEFVFSRQRSFFQ